MGRVMQLQPSKEFMESGLNDLDMTTAINHIYIVVVKGKDYNHAAEGLEKVLSWMETKGENQKGLLFQKRSTVPSAPVQKKKHQSFAKQEPFREWWDTTGK